MKFLAKIVLLLALAGVGGFFLVDDSQKQLLVTRAKVATGIEDTLPPGKVMIIQRVSVPQDDGARGVPRGSVVEFIEARGRTALLRDEDGEFEATIDQFTADSAVASMLRKQWGMDPSDAQR